MIRPLHGQSWIPTQIRAEICPDQIRQRMRRPQAFKSRQVRRHALLDNIHRIEVRIRLDPVRHGRG